jgi:Na+-transporting NADH:ubiquinone oxidoreductase subunit C
MPEASPRRRDSVSYTVTVAAGVCLVCAVVVSAAAVLLRPLQARNQVVDRLSKVLQVAALVHPGETLSAQAEEARFRERVEPRVVDLGTGHNDDSVDATTYDQRKAARDPQQSRPAPPNEARVVRLPSRAVVYEVMEEGRVKSLVLPIQGYGLWSTMYGYLALEADARTVAGITFYDHGETPGLGGEIENPRWQALWPGRQAFDDAGAMKLRVIKGAAGPASRDPHRVDGISGATITSRGVSSTLAFWLGPDAFGPYLKTFRAQSPATGDRRAP